MLRPAWLSATLALALLLGACGAPQATAPTAAPTTAAPTEAPTAAPTEAPTAAPTEAPTAAPTEAPTTAPTEAPTPPPEPEPIADIPIVDPELETQAILDMSPEDAPQGARVGDMDDPAIWVHPTDPAQSIVVGVMKEGGLEVYDLDGEVLQSIEPEGARYNNVDIRYGMQLGDRTVDFVAVTDRYEDKLVFYAIDPETRQLEDISDPENPLLFTPEGQESDEETTAYGITLYRSATSGTFYAFVNRRATGQLAQFELMDNGGTVAFTRVRELTLPTPEGGEEEDAQTEGMVADDELGVVYIGQENVGIWKVEAEPNSTAEPELIHRVAPDGEHLEADVEGLTIYYLSDGKGYLLVSSQGNNTFAVYTREGDNEYIGSFQIGRNGDIDGVQECDGAMALNVPLGPRFPQGLLVVQDGYNEPAVMVEDDGELENVSTSFKFVRWDNVAAAFDTPLMVDTTGYDPRK